jgi:hypothetical protein
MNTERHDNPASFPILAELVRAVLEHWDAYEWTVQGFGFIRTKLGSVGRIHVWDSTLAVPRVSTIHTHPWPLKSTIISGELINQRFNVCDYGLPYLCSDIATGEGGHLIGEPTEVAIVGRSPEFYTTGQIYTQDPDEFHRSIPQDGTVTLLERPQGPPLEKARVLFPRRTSWVSAEPRPAHDHETKRAIDCAVARWVSL